MLLSRLKALNPRNYRHMLLSRLKALNMQMEN